MPVLFLRVICGCFVFVVCAIGLGISPATATTIGPVLNPANGHSYYVFDEMVSWFAAETQAVALGGHLVTINDTAENAWIVSTLTVSGQRYWIGARDDATEGTFVWESGEPWSYTQWSSGEPDDDASFGGLGDFGFMSGTTGDWGDTNGSFVGFVTGGIAEVVPEPSVLVLLASFGLIVLRHGATRRALPRA